MLLLLVLLREVGLRINQKINFYSDDFKPPVIVMPAKQILQYSVAALIVLLLITVGLYYPIFSYEARLDALNDKLRAKTAELKETKSKYPKILKSQQLVDQLAVLQTQNANKLRLLNYLKSDSLQDAQHFSGVLDDLAEYDHKSVWLTRLDVLNEGRSIRLSGLVSKPDILPGYIDGLKKAESFNGRAFNLFNLERDADNASHLHFVLSTERTRGQDEG